MRTNVRTRLVRLAQRCTAWAYDLVLRLACRVALRDFTFPVDD